MNTPICAFVQNYIERDPVRAHMPGHKGKGGLNRLDITEVEGAGVLYAEQPVSCHSERSEDSASVREAEILRCAQNDSLEGSDVIAESERNAAALFGSAKTLYSTEGSSLCVRAMLYLARLHAAAQGKTPRILAGRNAHTSFLTAAALLDIEIEWLLPESGSALCCEITPERLAERLAEMEEPPTAVYITSPDYLGNLADLPGLARVCHSGGRNPAERCLLLVDNAHGAYLKFLPEDRHPMTLGADLCCDSAHKTLPVLTGGAYLHLAKGSSALLLDAAESAMRLFASTSPSYLMLQALDAINHTLDAVYPKRLAAFCGQVGQLADRLTGQGWRLRGDEPMKLTLDAKARGYTGTALAGLLRERGIECEFSDPDFLVLMLSPENSAEDLRRIEAALCAIPRRPAIFERPPLLPAPIPAVSPRQALLSASELLPVGQCLGRILAQPSVGCPPAVPIAICGEVLTQAHLDLFRYYGVRGIRVLRA